LTTLEITLICALVLAVSALVGASYFAVKFGLLILRVEDTIENSLDILDERYVSITKIIEIPLFSDSPQIRQVHLDLQRSREAVLSIAHVLVDDFKNLETIEEINDGQTTQENP